MYLNCHSYYSLRYGTLSIEKLVEQAAEACDPARTTRLAGAIRKLALSEDTRPAMALTDINNSTGSMDFIAACKERGIKPIAGIEFRQEDRLLYVGLARNNDGFRELNEFLSYHNLRNIPFPDKPPAFNNVFLVYPLLKS